MSTSVKKAIKYSAIFFAVLAPLLAWQAWKVYLELERGASEDPLVWEEAIQSLEVDARAGPGAVIFVGSSSIRLWSSLHEDMSPLTVVKRGFGGAKINDVLHYAERLIDLPDPLAVVIFVGTNDIHPGQTKKPQVLVDMYRELVSRIRNVHAGVPVYYIAITPSPLRWEVWDVALETNRLIAEFSSTQNDLFVIDTKDGLLQGGAPDESLYWLDGLHLNESGYAVWKDVIRPRLIEDLHKAQ